jgi:hypothetical protein
LSWLFCTWLSSTKQSINYLAILTASVTAEPAALAASVVALAASVTAPAALIVASAAVLTAVAAASAGVAGAGAAASGAAVVAGISAAGIDGVTIVVSSAFLEQATKVVAIKAANMIDLVMFIPVKVRGKG